MNRIFLIPHSHSRGTVISPKCIDEILSLSNTLGANFIKKGDAVTILTSTSKIAHDTANHFNIRFGAKVFLKDENLLVKTGQIIDLNWLYGKIMEFLEQKKNNVFIVVAPEEYISGLPKYMGLIGYSLKPGQALLIEDSKTTHIKPSS